MESTTVVAMISPSHIVGRTVVIQDLSFILLKQEETLPARFKVDALKSGKKEGNASTLNLEANVYSRIRKALKNALGGKKAGFDNWEEDIKGSKQTSLAIRY
nr:hypothetical protein Iba_chr15fCG5840 [Ipomoea batatas]